MLYDASEREVFTLPSSLAMYGGRGNDTVNTILISWKNEKTTASTRKTRCYWWH